LADCEQLNGQGETIGSWFFDSTRSSRKTLSSSPRLSFRHGDKIQIVFVDGSMRTLTEEEVYSDVLPWENK